MLYEEELYLVFSKASLTRLTVPAALTADMDRWDLEIADQTVRIDHSPSFCRSKSRCNRK
eukprot:3453323-Ditylum_brightwellii.AAC.1